MVATKDFLFRLNLSDGEALKEVARRMTQDQSETIRVLVRATLAVLREQDADNGKSSRLRDYPTELQRRMKTTPAINPRWNRNRLAGLCALPALFTALEI